MSEWSKKLVTTDIDMMLVKFKDKLTGLRKFKKELINIFDKIKALECEKITDIMYNQSETNHDDLSYTEMVQKKSELKSKLWEVLFHL